MWYRVVFKETPDSVSFVPESRIAAVTEESEPGQAPQDPGKVLLSFHDGSFSEVLEFNPVVGEKPVVSYGRLTSSCVDG